MSCNSTAEKDLGTIKYPENNRRCEVVAKQEAELIVGSINRVVSLTLGTWSSGRVGRIGLAVRGSRKEDQEHSSGLWEYRKGE